MIDDSLLQPRRAAYNVLVAAVSASLLACWSACRSNREHAISLYTGKIGVKETVRSKACLRGDRVTDLSNADVSSEFRESREKRCCSTAHWILGDVHAY